MKHILIAAISICVFHLPLSAQQKKALIGTWKVVRTDSNDITIIPLKKESFSFYRSGNCRIDEELLKTDSLGLTRYINARKWEMNKSKNLVLSSPYKHASMLPEEYIITSLTDSSLVMSYSIENITYTKHLTKSIPIPETELYRELNRKERRQFEKHYYLVNSADTTKRIKIKSSNISFTIDESSTDSTIKSITTWIDADIYGLKDSTISLYFNHSTTTITYATDATLTKEKNNWEDGYKTDFALSTIERISFSNPARETVNIISSAVIYVSAQTLLIIAPLVSIKYKRGDGGFNTTRYFNLCGISLAALAASIPSAALSMEKSYSITTKNGMKDKEHWYFSN